MQLVLSCHLLRFNYKDKSNTQTLLNATSLLLSNTPSTIPHLQYPIYTHTHTGCAPRRRGARTRSCRPVGTPAPAARRRTSLLSTDTCPERGAWRAHRGGQRGSTSCGGVAWMVGCWRVGRQLGVWSATVGCCACNTAVCMGALCAWMAGTVSRSVRVSGGGGGWQHAAVTARCIWRWVMIFCIQP